MPETDDILTTTVDNVLKATNDGLVSLSNHYEEKLEVVNSKLNTLTKTFEDYKLAHPEPVAPPVISVRPPVTTNPVSPPVSVPTPGGWSLLKKFDLTKDEGWTWTGRDTGTKITNNNATFSSRSAKFGSGPDGKSLVIEGRRTGYNSWTSAEGRFYPLKVPPYFRAEVVASCAPMVSGMWPCPLWFRPNGFGEGEIDNNEMYGKEPELNRLAHYSIHKTPYGAEHQHVGKTFPLKSFGDPSAEKEHSYVIEKVKGKMDFFIDGKLVATHSPLTATWYNAMFEVGTLWLPIVTLQIGKGTKVQVAGDVPASWTATDLVIRSLNFWKQA